MSPADLAFRPADLAAIRFAGRGLRTRRNKALWARDPVAWLHDRMGEHAWSKQAEVMHSVADNVRTAVPSCHGVGKSHGASRTGLWWIDTAESVEDRFLVTTAPSWPQVKTILWRYMRQGHRERTLHGQVVKPKLVGDILQNAEWKIDGDIVGYGRKPADRDETGFQGIHASEGVLIVLDEACGVPAQLFVAADALATNETSRVLAIGNPDDNSSHFAAVCQRPDEGWNVIPISAFDSPNLSGERVCSCGEQLPDRMLRALVRAWWVRDKQLRWGETNPLYIAKVLGQFADAEDGLIPLSWVRAAHARWHQWQDRRADSPVKIDPPGRLMYGVDVAWLGEDKTAIAPRQGDIVNPDGQDKIERHAREDTTQTTGRVQAKIRAHPQAHVVVDVVGVGAGVYDQLSRAGASVSAFNGAKPTQRRDSTGEWKFPNVRSAAWWNLRELLDPAMGATLALPPDDDLTADLTTPKWEPRAGGVIVVESKDDIRRRLGHSPDAGDAVAEVCWVDAPGRDAVDSAPAETIPYADAVESGYDADPQREFARRLAEDDYGASDDYL